MTANTASSDAKIIPAINNALVNGGLPDAEESAVAFDRWSGEIAKVSRNRAPDQKHPVPQLSKTVEVDWQRQSESKENQHAIVNKPQMFPSSDHLGEVNFNRRRFCVGDRNGVRVRG